MVWKSTYSILFVVLHGLLNPSICCRVYYYVHASVQISCVLYHSLYVKFGTFLFLSSYRLCHYLKHKLKYVNRTRKTKSICIVHVLILNYKDDVPTQTRICNNFYFHIIIGVAFSWYFDSINQYDLSIDWYDIFCIIVMFNNRSFHDYDQTFVVNLFVFPIRANGLWTKRHCVCQK